MQRPDAADVPERRRDHPQARNHPPGAPVVGVVCSAGGLKALKALFAAVAPDSGLAWVVAPHLAPDQPSMLVELLQQHTSIPVETAAESLAPAPDHVYVSPPAQALTLRGGHMRLTPLRGSEPSRAALDRLLVSLAEDRGVAAMGVVLSGTGDAGVAGLRAIVDAGGFTVAQLPATADYAAMPEAAIDAGLADAVLTPAQIPAALLEHVGPGDGASALLGFSAEPAEQSALHRILELMRTRTRYDFRDYRQSMVGRRIRRRMELLGAARSEDYLALLRAEPTEVEELYRELMIGVSGFFRDPDAFGALREQVIEPLVQGHADEQPLRVWVPGCTTGEEAYSIAMLLLETFDEGGRAANVQVFATDIDEAALQQARQGIYTEAALQDLSTGRRERFFTSLGGARRQVVKPLREAVVFATQNLLTDPPFSRIDLISCRNVLIYLKPEAQEQIIARFHFALNEGGFLFLGSSEAVGRYINLFEALSPRWRVFRRIGPSRQDSIGIAPGSTQTPAPSIASQPAWAPEQRVDVKDTARRVLCELYAPASVLIDAGYEVLYYHGPTADYLEMPSGEPTRSLLELLRKGLRTPVRAACQTALRDRGPVRVAEAEAVRGNTRVPVEVLVYPVRESRLAKRLLLVTFRDSGPAETPLPAEVIEQTAGEAHSTIDQLEFELRATRDDLESTIDDWRSANEQLRAANEEVISTNEELQSANEELQTSQEELQSLNEELTTVNSQMQEKVTELEQRNSDINNLINSSNTVTVFLDRELRIKLFTPACQALLNLRPNDQDRPLAELQFRIDDPHLLADCRSVLESLQSAERQVGDGAGRQWLRRVLPYRDAEDRIDGVIITLVDITALAAAEAKLRASERHYRRLFEDAPIQTLEQDWSGVSETLKALGPSAADPDYYSEHPQVLADCRAGIRLTAINAAARALLGIPEDVVMPRQLPALCCAGQLDKLLAAFAAGQRVALCEDVITDAAGRELPMLCQFALIPGSETSLERVLVMMLDLSAQKALERRLADSELRLRRALQVVHEAVWEYDVLRNRLWWSDEYERQFGKPDSPPSRVRDWWVQGIHPADREAAQAKVQAAIDGTADDWQAEYRYRRPDGDYVDVLERGAVDRDADGKAMRLLGCMLDVSDLKATQQALAEREARLRAVLDAAADAIVTTDAEGHIQSFNAAAEAMFGYSADDISGTSVRKLLSATDAAQADPLVDREDRQPQLLNGHRATGDDFPLELSARFDPTQNLWVLVGRDVTEWRRLERDVIDLSTRQQEELGREIHDGLGQELTALVMLAHSLRRQLDQHQAQQSAEAFAQLEDYLRHALESCRSIARGLSAEVSAPGLENALAELAAGMERASGIPCRFTHTGPSGAVGEHQAAHLYRIAQEALSNALRHAEAKHVDMSLEVGETELTLRVRDNGQGIAPDAKRGLGLRLMAYRAGMLGGTCVAEPAAGGGTLVACRIPSAR
ncbi:CheR family methyltransferase [Thiohalocapsa halophila]|uniref:CheR family methyltransferase n=1 Tax=Thiohalocapsa halophila TaxID=69359 RepID=UPI00190716FF|nr:CheR family methyltransferase [Thiohalocapsa halophila]